MRKVKNKAQLKKSIEGMIYGILKTQDYIRQESRPFEKDKAKKALKFQKRMLNNTKNKHKEIFNEVSNSNAINDLRRVFNDNTQGAAS